jgi:hypothetical protein
MNNRTRIIHCCAFLLPALASCGSPPKEAPKKAPQVVSIPQEPEPAPPTSASAVAPTTMSLKTRSKRLTAISVKTRLPDLAEKHAKWHRDSLFEVRFKLIAEAVERADADMFVSYVAGSEELFPLGLIRLTDDGHFGGYPDGDVSSGALDKYAMTTHFGYAPSSTSYLLSPYFEAKPLPDRSPGLVWKVEDQGVLFVSLDGESYAVDVESLRPGVGATSSWPKPVPNPAFGRLALPYRREESTPLGPVDDAFAKCADQAWVKAQQAMTPKQREAPLTPRGSVVRKACAKEIAAWDVAFAANIDASVKRRTALYEKAKARVDSLTKAP